MDRRPNKARRQGAIARLVNHWIDRLVGAASQRSFSGQEEQYSSHQTTRDFIFNSLGIGVWGVVFPLLTIVITQLVGADQAGIFSLAFVTGTLLMIIGNYGVRTYQVSDIDEDHSFADYQINRIITCILMVVAGYVYCCILRLRVRHVRHQHGRVPVPHGRRAGRCLRGAPTAGRQDVSRGHLAGISKRCRARRVQHRPLCHAQPGVLVHHHGNRRGGKPACPDCASRVHGDTQVAPLGNGGVVNLFKRCFPVFVALFLYCLIDNMPKFRMEGPLSYDNQLYFNVLYFPGQAFC